MLQSRLIVLLRSFSKAEFKRFGAFLSSPYHNQSENMIKMFKLLEPHQPMFESKKLEKEKLYPAMYGNRKYNDLTIRKLISEMFKLAKEFLSYEELRKDDMLSGELRYKWFFDHSIKKMADAELEAGGLLLDAHKQHDKHYYHHRWIHDLNKFEITAEQFRGEEYKLLKDFDFYAHVHSLNRNYLINCITSHHYLITLARIYKFSLNEELLQQVETVARPYLNTGDKVIDIYFLIFQLARTDEEKCFFELKALFFENHDQVPEILGIDTGISLQNYCAKKIREGEHRFSVDSMEIYRFVVENNFHLLNGKLNYTMYFNIAIRGSETDQLDWVDYFIENYNQYLDEDLREEAYNFSKAHVLFARRKFQEALRMALCCGTALPVHKILTRYLVARSQFELGMMDELQVELDALRYHLKDRHINDDRKQHLQTFTATMKQLNELKVNFNQQKSADLLGEVEIHTGLPYRRWFLEKIRELKESDVVKRR
jgi:hypothetical protein